MKVDGSGLLLTGPVPTDSTLTGSESAGSELARSSAGDFSVRYRRRSVASSSSTNRTLK